MPGARTGIACQVQSPSQAYRIGALSVFASRAVTMASGVLSLWFLVRILEVDDFAGYAVAMSVVSLLGFAAGLGIERSLLLRIAELPPHPSRLAGRGLMLRTALVVFILSCLLCLLVVGLLELGPLAAAGQTAAWIERLIPIVPATALTLVLVTWYQANHKIGVSQLMFGVNDGSRCLVFGVAFVLGLGSAAVAFGAIVASLLPIAALALLALGRTADQPRSLRFADVSTGLLFLVTRLSTMGLQQLGLVGMGFLAGSAETAAYAVASRIAALMTLGQAAFLNTYAPRVRRHLALNDHAAVAREYHTTRVLAFLMTLALALAFLVFGHFVLGLFGDFQQGYTPLLLMSAGQLVSAGSGDHGTHLAMSEGLGPSALNRAATCALFVLLLGVLVPWLAGVGAALAFLIASTVYAVAGMAILYRKTAIQPITPLFGSAVALGALGLCLAAYSDGFQLAAVAMTIAAAIVAMLAERRLLLMVLSTAARGQAPSS